MASKRNGTLYIGVTNDIVRRAWEHREGRVAGFTRKHGVKLLVYCQPFEDISAAIHREDRLKKWKRRWKLELIEKNNPDWQDLYDEMTRRQELSIHPLRLSWPAGRPSLLRSFGGRVALARRSGWA